MRFKNTVFTENIRIALQSVSSHLLRTILTVSIIAFGIMALVGILTSIDAVKNFFEENFMRMGANTFTIRNRSLQSEQRRGSSDYKAISWAEAKQFKEQFTFPSVVSVSVQVSWNATAVYRSRKTNPNLRVTGIDENYLYTSGEELAVGRSFTPDEVLSGSYVCILGYEVAQNLFPGINDPTGEMITLGPGRYIVVGVLKKSGSSFGFSGDRNVYIPINNARQRYSLNDKSFSINVLVGKATSLDAAIGEATGLFRQIRKLRLGQNDNFSMVRSDSFVNMMLENTRLISLAATIIGLITLAGAAIGLMNIMLVSVTERTREIGIRRAVGAKRRNIMTQFILEAVVLCEVGGVLGVLLGLAGGNAAAWYLEVPPAIPVDWVVLGLVICSLVGVVFGTYPAYKAANLDPIESLRYE